VTRHQLLTAGVLLLVAAAAPSPARAQTAALADTLYSLPQFEMVDTTGVEADSLTLREIIQRCTVGEKTKLAGHHDVTYTAEVRLVLLWKKKKEVHEEVYAAYEDSSGSHTVRLDERTNKFKRDGDDWVADSGHDDEKNDEVNVEINDDSESMFTQIPFFLEEQQEFDFELLSRTLETDRVIFKIGFKPKSEFKPLPSGIVYVDTQAYRIIHEEFWFDKNPFPMLLGTIHRVSRQWEPLPTGEWVATKILFDMDLKGGWTGLIPGKVTGGVVVTDYRFDQGYDEARFGKR